MITETGRIVAVESDCLWVETIRRSTCNSCSAQKACGHGLINSMGSKKTGRSHHVRVLLNGENSEDFSVNDQVELSMPEQALVRAALIVYLLPLLMMLLGAIIVSQFTSHDVMAFLGSLAGLLVGFSLVKLHGLATRDSKDFQAVVTAPHSQVVDCLDLKPSVVPSP